jgi:hypothetical protein
MYEMITALADSLMMVASPQVSAPVNASCTTRDDCTSGDCLNEVCTVVSSYCVYK